MSPQKFDLSNDDLMTDKQIAAKYPWLPFSKTNRKRMETRGFPKGFCISPHRKVRPKSQVEAFVNKILAEAQQTVSKKKSKRG